MKEYKYISVKLLSLIDEYGFCRAMRATLEPNCEDAEIYKERAANALKEIWEILDELEERTEKNEILL